MDLLKGTGPSMRGYGKKIVLWITFLLVGLAMSPLTWAESLTPPQQEALKKEAIPLYPDSSFLTSDEVDATMILWFATKDKPAKIMAWYKKKLADWSENEMNGIKVLYKGPPGLEFKQLTDKPYIFTSLKTESEPVMTEITIRIPIK